MTEWLRLLEVVQSREALHRVDISVPETLQVIHKSCPSTYTAVAGGYLDCYGQDERGFNSHTPLHTKKQVLELALSSNLPQALPSSTMLTHGRTWWGFFIKCYGVRTYVARAGGGST